MAKILQGWNNYHTQYPTNDTKEEAVEVRNRRIKIMENITIEELKNDCKRLIKQRLSGVLNSADILNYATAIAELEKNELVKKLADTNAGVFGASSPIEAQLVCNEEPMNERS